jgi:hypothetical protein|tara:strand:+ start:633 stop:1850 length:1218 start_codon:yes stop_codon:yes gene_type:complete
MSTYYKESNAETTVKLFDKKVLYDAKVLGYVEKYPNVTNFNFGEKFLYGRVNRTFIPIQVANYEDLKGFARANLADQSMSALNFVVDAFNALALQFTKCVAVGKINADDPYLSSLIVYKAYENPMRLYSSYKNGYFAALSANFKKTRANLKSFDQFVEQLLSVLRLPAKTAPFTQTAFVKSRRCPITVSGLAVEIADLIPSNDDKKINAFVNSKTWEFYLNACKSYGFMVDASMPWRLVADIGSSAMLEYAAKYGLGRTDIVLWSAYEYSHLSYFNNFRSDLLYLYNLSKEKTILETQECNGKTITNIITPPTYSLTDLEANYSETYFLDLYFKIRIMEDESKFADFEQESLIRDCLQIYATRGLNRALLVFETIVNKPFDYRGSLSYNSKHIQAVLDAADNLEG